MKFERIVFCTRQFAKSAGWSKTNQQPTYLVEVVHVELPDEGAHVGVLVVVGELGLGEGGLVVDDEGPPVGGPADDVVGAGVVHHLPELSQEGRNVAAGGGLLLSRPLLLLPGAATLGDDDVHGRQHLLVLVLGFSIVPSDLEKRVENEGKRVN